MPPAVTWTPARVNELRQLLEAGKSYREIALQMDLSKNTVLGKAWRLGLKPHETEEQRKAKAQARLARQRERRAAHAGTRTIKFHPKRTVPMLQNIKCEEALNITIHELERHHCRWITNDDTSAALYCGATVVDGYSWCPFHLQKIWPQPEYRRAAAMKVAA